MVTLPNATISAALLWIWMLPLTEFTPNSTAALLFCTCRLPPIVSPPLQAPTSPTSIGAPEPLFWTWTLPVTVAAHRELSTPAAGRLVRPCTWRFPATLPPSTSIQEALSAWRSFPIVAPSSSSAPPCCTCTFPLTFVPERSVHTAPDRTVTLWPLPS